VGCGPSQGNKSNKTHYNEAENYNATYANADNVEQTWMGDDDDGAGDD
jgi:hypothetical protein